MPDDIQHIQHELGDLSASVRGLSVNLERSITTNESVVNKIFAKLDGLPKQCPTGERLEKRMDASEKQSNKRIEKLETRPEKAVGLVASIVAVVSAIWATWISRGN